MATINEIKQQAAAVKNATQVGENTAERVGGALAGLADIAEQQDSKFSDLYDANMTEASRLFNYPLSEYTEWTGQPFDFILANGFDIDVFRGIRLYTKFKENVYYAKVSRNEDSYITGEYTLLGTSIENEVCELFIDEPIMLANNEAIAIRIDHLYWENSNREFAYMYDSNNKTWFKNPSASLAMTYLCNITRQELEKNVKNNTDALNSLSKKVDSIQGIESKKRCVFSIIKHSSDLSNYNHDRWNIDNTKRCLTNISTGVGSMLSYKYGIHIDKRRITAKLTPNINATVFIGFSYNVDYLNSATIASVDFKNKEISIFKKTGAYVTSIENLVKAKSLNIPIEDNYNDFVYEFILERYNSYGIRCALFNITLNRQLCGEIIFNELTSESLSPIQGEMYDYPLLFCDGTINLYSFSITSPSFDNVRMMICGDSITEGYGITDIEKSWSRRAASFIGNSVVSARSGGGISTFKQQIIAEIPYINPEYIVIAYGHNDNWGADSTEPFKNNLIEVINSVKQMGITPILACIPRTLDSNVNTDTNKTILSVADENDLSVIRFDIATSINNSIENGIDSSLFYDGTHLNEIGNMKMYERFIADCSDFLYKS